MSGRDSSIEQSTMAAGGEIRDHAETIIQRWIGRVSANPDIPGEHRDALRNHLPLLLKHIGNDLLQARKQSEQTEEIAEKHGKQRWQLGWRLEDVVRDYQTLRPVIERFLQEELKDLLTIETMSHVSRMIDEAVVDSIRRYTEFHDSLDQDSHRSASEYAAIVSSSHDAIIGMTPEGVIQSWNRAAEKIYGYTAEEAIGRHGSLTVPEQRIAAFDQMLKRIRDGRTVAAKDTLRQSKDGRELAVSVAASPILDRSGTVVGCATIERDVSKRMQAAEALRNAMEAAETANTAKSEFLASVSHELRSPMNAIIGMTALTLDEDIPATVRDNLTVASQAADQMLSLVDDLLDISKLEAGKLEFEEAPFSLRHTLDETMKLASVRAFEKGLEIACRVDRDVPDSLRGDARRLQQILTNLVSNAVKFTDQGEIIVDVSLRITDREVCEIDFRVEDTGIGIPKDEQERIFTPFVQVDASTTRPQGGTGLGLSIASHLVECLGGKLRVDSRPGEGSVFSFSARLRRATRVTRTSDLASPIQQLKNIGVLVIDDSEATRSIVREMLTGWGMRPVTVDRTDRAIKVLSDAHRSGRPFKLVLVDALMPHEDGFTFLERVQSHEDLDVKTVLMISPSDRLAMREKCHASSVDGFLEKPICQSGLFDAVMKMLGNALPLSEPDEKSPSPSVGSLGPLKVLLAEDTPANQKVVEQVMAKLGHELTIANNGREALDLIRHEEFDVLLMDVQMPIMDGFQATAAIRAHEAASRVADPVPIIAMTAHAMSGDRDRCLAAGMNDYIAKPIDIADLADRIERLGRGPASGARPVGANLEDHTGEASRDSGGDTLSEAGQRESVDLGAALERLRGDRGLLADLINCYGEDYGPLLEEISHALERGDLTAVHRAAHTLKGLAANFDAKWTQRVAREIEESAAAGAYEDAVRRSPELSLAARSLAKLLQDQLPTVSSGAE